MSRQEQSISRDGLDSLAHCMITVVLSLTIEQIQMFGQQRFAKTFRCYSLIQDVLGDVLAQALSNVARERPSDPIEFVADFLYKKRQEEKDLELASNAVKAANISNAIMAEAVEEAVSRAATPIKPSSGESNDSGLYEEDDEAGDDPPDPATYSERDKGPSSAASSVYSASEMIAVVASRAGRHTERRSRQRSRNRRTAQSEPANNSIGSSLSSNIRKVSGLLRIKGCNLFTFILLVLCPTNYKVSGEVKSFGDGVAG
jgi:hypothetical protein